MLKSTWDVECDDCLELTNVECELSVEKPQACPMCGSGSVTVTSDINDDE